MDLPHLLSSGAYRFAQKGHQTISAQWISLSVSGLLSSRLYYPDGKLCSSFDARTDTPKNHLSLETPGFVTDFEYGPDRENWVIIFNSDALFYQASDRRHYLNYNGTPLPVPRTIELTPGELEPLRHTFRTITENFFSTIPRNLLAAEIMTQSLLLRFLQIPQPEDDPVEHLRRRIDADIKWERSIEEHCRELSCGRDHLRRLFEQRYKIAPGEYRIQKRLQQIVRLIAYSSMNLKEIAYEVGMRNPTHLNSLLRQRYGKTPSELRREYRGTTARLPV